MTFGAPTALIFLAVIPPLLYWRARASGRRRMPTTTAAIWRRLIAETESTARRKFRVSKDVLFEGAALLLVLLCAASPRIPSSGRGTVLLIEDGVGSSTEKRLDEIRGIIRELSQGGGNLRIVTVGAGRIENAPDFDRASRPRTARPELMDWRNAVESARGKADRIVAVAGELTTEIKDRWPKDVRVIGLKSAVSNAGLTAAFLRTDPAGGRTAALLTVEKTTSTPSGAVRCLLRAGGATAVRTFDLKSGGRATVEIELAAATTDRVEVEIAPRDSGSFKDEIPADDRVVFFRENRRPRAAVAEQLDVFADALLCLDFDVVSGIVGEGEGFDLAVGERAYSGTATSLVVTARSTEPFILGDLRPVAEFVLRAAESLTNDRRWPTRVRAAIAPIDLSKSRAQPLLFADDAAFIALTDDRKTIGIAADPRISPLFERPEFPVILRAILEQAAFSRDRGGFVARRAGESSAARFEDGARVRFFDREGHSVEIPYGADAVAGPLHFPFVGRYEIEQGGGKTVVEAAVLDAIATRAPEGEDRAALTEHAAREKDVSIFFAFALVAVAACLLFIRGATLRGRSGRFDAVPSR